MKSFKNLSILILSLVFFCSFSLKDSPSYVGKWKGDDKGDVGYLTLSEDNYATFEFNGEIMGGKSFDHKGTSASMKYKVDTSYSPYRIDFVIIDNGNEDELGRLKGIVKMIESNKMRLALGFGESERPTDFSEENSIYFDRHKE